MSENSEYTRDEGEMAEEALKNPTTTFDKIMNSMGMVGVFVLIAGVAVTKYVRENVYKEVSEQAAFASGDAQGVDEARILEPIRRSQSYERCMANYRPSASCDGKLGENMEEMRMACENMATDSSSELCCSELSGWIRQCLDRNGLLF